MTYLPLARFPPSARHLLNLVCLPGSLVVALKETFLPPCALPSGRAVSRVGGGMGPAWSLCSSTSFSSSTLQIT